MTQRLTEELEYSRLLDQAASCENSLEQICYIAAFSISCYASTAIRTGKPFNPLLGETYECDRTQDMGWTSLAEQVILFYFISKEIEVMASAESFVIPYFLKYKSQGLKMYTGTVIPLI